MYFRPGPRPRATNHRRDRDSRILFIDRDRIESTGIQRKIIIVGQISPPFLSPASPAPSTPIPLPSLPETNSRRDQRTDRSGKKPHSGPSYVSGNARVSLKTIPALLGPVRPIIKAISADTDSNVCTYLANNLSPDTAFTPPHPPSFQSRFQRRRFASSLVQGPKNSRCFADGPSALHGVYILG